MFPVIVPPVVTPIITNSSGNTSDVALTSGDQTFLIGFLMVMLGFIVVTFIVAMVMLIKTLNNY